jgi:hypothetical protein
MLCLLAGLAPEPAAQALAAADGNVRAALAASGAGQT